MRLTSPVVCSFLFSALATVPSANAQEAVPAGPALTIVHAAPQHTVALVPLTGDEASAQELLRVGKTNVRVPDSFREFGTIQAGQNAEIKQIKLQFSAFTQLTKIESTRDFVIEQGGSCQEGSTYAINATCTLLVRFTPQGPGRRTGKLAVSTATDATPFAIGLGGYGSAPVISFTPSLITTVPGTYVNGAGLLSGATNLAIDGGDALYMADTTNLAVRYLGADGTISTVPFAYPLSDPEGVAVDGFNDVFVSQPEAQNVQILFSNGIYGNYSNESGSCPYGTTCPLSNATLSAPGAFASDPYGNLFLYDTDTVDQLTEPSVYNFSYTPLGDAFSSNEVTQEQGPLAVDASDSIYGYDSVGGNCQLFSNTYAQSAANTYGYLQHIAGGRGCGFSGDGGQSRSALISSYVVQMVFDQAGNLYFTDSNNQRVRRIDASTSIISTIAGNGATGYAGDGGPATSAALNSPTGLAVDSQGQVYIISSATTSGQVVREVGVIGALTMGGSRVGVPTTAQTINVANTGNSTLTFDNVSFSSGNTTDFAIDPHSTNCVFTNPLSSGQSCKIGFIFTPTATGARSAVLTMTDNTIATINNIQLTGAGLVAPSLTPATYTFASTPVNSTSGKLALTLTNPNSVTLTGIATAFAGTNPSSFALSSSTCGSTLAAGASCVYSVVFTPKATGSLTASFAVTSAAPAATTTLSGTGAASAAVASLSPATFTFNSRAVGTTSTATTYTLTNSGGSTLSNIGVSLGGTNPTSFTVSSTTCGTTLAVSANCAYSVTFSPKATGALTASLAVSSNVATVAATINGTGTASAAQPKLSPAPYTFNSRAAGTSSTAKLYTLSNAGGSALTGIAASFTGLNPADFSIQSTTCGATLAAGASCTYSVIFKPLASGTFTATLSVASNVAAATVSISGTATPSPAIATLMLSAYTFDSRAVGTTSTTKAYTLHNTGGETLVSISAALTGANAADFAISNSTCGQTLAPGATCILSVIFKPVTAGSLSTILSVTSSAARVTAAATGTASAL